jgi:hypothetical protein
MRCGTGLGSVMLLSVAAFLLVGMASTAMALPAVQDVLGRYDGFYQSAVNPGDRGTIQVTVTEQHRRRFEGIATIGAEEFPFEGTIAASGEVSLEGGNAAARLRGHGTTRFFGDGSVFVQIKYQFHPPDPGRGGVRDNGLMILLRDAEFEGAPNVVGRWDGSYQSTMDRADRGDLSVDVTGQDGSGFTGDMTVNELHFAFVGSIGKPPNPNLPPNPCHLIGLGPAGWFLVSGELTPGDPDAATGILPYIEAHYQLFFTDGSRDAGTFDVSMRPGLPN